MARERAVIDMSIVIAGIRQRVANGVNAVGENARQKAVELVPQRKVFRYGRTTEGLRYESRQSVRTLTPGEVNREKGRRAAGVDYQNLYGRVQQKATGRRTLNPEIQTTWFPEFGYRSIDRANAGGGGPRSRRVAPSERRTIERRPVVTVTGVDTKKITVERFLTDEYAMADLSAAGRYEFFKRRHKEDDPTGKGRYKKGDFVHKNQLGGALLRSITHVKASANRKPTYILKAGGEDAPYAKYVEFGTRHAKAQPFLRPALAQARGELKAVVEEYLRRPV